MLNWSIVQLLNMQQNERKKKGDQGFKNISASGLEHSSFIMVYIMPVGFCYGNSQPQSFAKRVLSPPACGRPGSSNFCYTHLVWMRSPWSTRLHPRRTAVVMVTQPITVTEGGAGIRGCHRWLFQFTQNQIGALPLYAGDRARPWPTPYQLRFRGHMHVWGYIWVLIFANSDGSFRRC